jgi:hypothetical protein
MDAYVLNENSLLPGKNSLFLRNNFPALGFREFVREIAAVRGFVAADFASGRPKFAEFPVKFPVTRESAWPWTAS